MAIEAQLRYYKYGSGTDGVRDTIFGREDVDPEDCYIDHFNDDHSCNLGETEVELVVVVTCPLIDGAVDLLNIQDVFSFGSGFDTKLQEGQCATEWFKLPVHLHFLDVESTLGVVRLDLLDCLNHRIDALVLGNHCHEN